MARDPELQPDTVLDRGGVKVSKSPWGSGDEIGRLNWITKESTRAILDHLDGNQVFDMNVEYFIGMPSWLAAGDPGYGIWMDHTPQGSINDDLSGACSAVHEKYSYCGDSIHMYTHCGTHIDTLTHMGFYGKFWNGWTADEQLGSRVWNKGGPEKYPPVIARGVLLDVAGMKGVDVLPDSTRSRRGPPGDREAAKSSSVGATSSSSAPAASASGPTSTAISRKPRGSALPRRSGFARRRARCASAATRSGSR